MILLLNAIREYYLKNNRYYSCLETILEELLAFWTDVKEFKLRYDWHKVAA